MFVCHVLFAVVNTFTKVCATKDTRYEYKLRQNSVIRSVTHTAWAMGMAFINRNMLICKQMMKKSNTHLIIINFMKDRNENACNGPYAYLYFANVLFYFSPFLAMEPRSISVYLSRCSQFHSHSFMLLRTHANSPTRSAFVLSNTNVHCSYRCCTVAGSIRNVLMYLILG